MCDKGSKDAGNSPPCVCAITWYDPRVYAPVRGTTRVCVCSSTWQGLLTMGAPVCVCVSTY